MRMLAIAQIDVEAGNEAVRSGAMRQLMDRIMSRLQPEAAYFGPLDGVRTMFLVFDLDDPSRIPSMMEPFFDGLKAKVQLTPVMNREEVQAGLASIR
ncbi:DUF3303 family protein [Umezawaea beigongshangensis]|uniref:DUF3303 family protein n=1 Tax=Umezawaea beigongshangensis TaxID=2780383 RepID=UPI0018F23771|nr:DUF3303 family protein [Umezawaea beigongshangensis]